MSEEQDNTVSVSSANGVPVELEVGACVERYVVVAKIGKGGMGVVYKAYDPDLDRNVALKLLVVDAGDDDMTTRGPRARLLREAQALARLSHPNVVSVFDVGTHGKSVFIAMELIEGCTLRTWLKNEKPGYKEILPIFLAVGRGLAAAHEEGLIHRDVKPDNVLVGANGRVVVVDFGLARYSDPKVIYGPPADSPKLCDDDLETKEFSGEIPSPVAKNSASDASRDDLDSDSSWSQSSGRQLLSSRVTQIGSVLGTPRYMSPEQLVGARVDERSDQYSLAVSLYEALYGQSPFPSKELTYDGHGFFARPMRPPPEDSPVPKRIADIIVRGLEPDPEERFASVAALLAELERDPDKERERKRRARRRGLLLASVGLCIGLAVLGTIWVVVDRAKLCSGAEQKLAGIWNADVSHRMEQGFAATKVTYAGESWSRVERVLGKYAADWSSMYTQACEATRIRGEQSEELLDRRMVCLGSRLQEFESLTAALLEADARVVGKAVSAVFGLPAISQCGDLAALMTKLSLPPDENTRRQVAEIRGKLAKAKTMEGLGKYQDGMKALAGVPEQARQVGYPPVVVEADFRVGRLEEKTGHYEKSLSTMREVLWLSVAQGDDDTEVDAANEIVFILTERLNQPKQAEWALRLAQAVLDRRGKEDRLVAGWLQKAGIHAFTMGNYEQAEEHFRTQVAVLGKLVGSDHPMLASALNALGVAVEARHGIKAAIEPFTRALAIRRRAYGESHPRVAMSHNNLALALMKTGDHQQGKVHAERAVVIWEATLSPEHPNVAMGLNTLGLIRANLGEFDAAEQHLTRSLRLRQKAFGDIHPRVALTWGAMTELALLRGDFPTAIAHGETTVSIVEQARGKDHPVVADVLVTLGVVHYEAGSFSKARQLFDRAVHIREAALGPSDLRTGGALAWRGMALLGEGMFAEANRVCARVLDICAAAPCRLGDEPRAMFCRAKVLWSQQQQRELSAERAAAALEIAQADKRIHLEREIVQWLSAREQDVAQLGQ